MKKYKRFTKLTGKETQVYLHVNPHFVSSRPENFPSTGGENMSAEFRKVLSEMCVLCTHTSYV
jgi:hypothetical protein